MKASLTILVILFLAAIFVGQPTNTIAADPEITVTETEQYKLHAEPSERLNNIMQNLLALMDRDTTEEITLSQENLADMTEAVEELLFFAELMSIKVPATELEENENVIFSAMANQLYDEALNIQQLANNYDIEVIDAEKNQLLNLAFERMNRTCAACHQLFRDN